MQRIKIEELITQSKEVQERLFIAYDVPFDQPQVEKYYLSHMRQMCQEEDAEEMQKFLMESEITPKGMVVKKCCVEWFDDGMGEVGEYVVYLT